MSLVTSPVKYRAIPSHEFQELLRRLTVQYGVNRSLAILDGRDAATNADLRAWRSLGSPKREQIA